MTLGIFQCQDKAAGTAWVFSRPLPGLTPGFTFHLMSFHLANAVACSSLCLNYTSTSLQCTQLLSTSLESKAIWESTSHALSPVSPPSPARTGEQHSLARDGTSHAQQMCVSIPGTAAWLGLAQNLQTKQPGTTCCSKKGQGSSYCKGSCIGNKSYLAWHVVSLCTSCKATVYIGTEKDQ